MAADALTSEEGVTSALSTCKLWNYERKNVGLLVVYYFRLIWNKKAATMKKFDLSLRFFELTNKIVDIDMWNSEQSYIIKIITIL